MKKKEIEMSGKNFVIYFYPFVIDLYKNFLNEYGESDDMNYNRLNEIIKWNNHLNELIKLNQFPKHTLNQLSIIAHNLLEKEYIIAEEKYLQLNAGISYEGITPESRYYNDESIKNIKLLPADDMRNILIVYVLYI